MLYMQSYSYLQEILFLVFPKWSPISIPQINQPVFHDTILSRYHYRQNTHKQTKKQTLPYLRCWKLHVCFLLDLLRKWK